MARATARSDAAGRLPHALTFFLSPEERRAVLRALRKRHTDRARALCLALRVEENESNKGNGE